MQTPFHAYLEARKLESESSGNDFAAVFASSHLKVYPFQIAAVNFALKSPYQKGVILCDESGMGKSHEAMLVVSQKWLEGKNKIVIAIPNIDLLRQWTQLIDKHYTIPYITLTNSLEWNGNVSLQNSNGFMQDAIVITTYDLLAEHPKEAKAVKWDLCVFEEANALSSVYLEGNKQAKILKDIAADSYKILLTGTPIEKNIMDLYGLMYFIDETVLPDEQTFLKRYLRKPELYPELAESVSKYCFRTLRRQAKQYALVSNRIHITLEYTPTKEEQKVYDLLYTYVNKEKKVAFPEMNTYDLSLRLLGILGSSTAAILSTLDGILSRLKDLPNSGEEVAELEIIRTAALSVALDEKAKQLTKAIPKVFATLKKLCANKKSVIFTESVETQKYLYKLLKDKYKTTVYNGSTDYTAIANFKTDGEILISTDNGARGFNLEEACFVVNYDLLFNTLKMEQRIDRCHRLGQNNDVIALAFMDKSNFAEVRKLELMNKRLLVSDGVFGVSDHVVGGFTCDLDAALKNLETTARTREQVESDYLKTLSQNQEQNEELVDTAEEILFTTFTKTLADKVRVAPKYIEEKAQRLNDRLWELAKYFFENYNKNNSDCTYIIDEINRTLTAENYKQLPCLFYYFSGSGNKRYYSQKQYGMAKDFKPSYGRITLTSILGKGILSEIDCANNGEMTVTGNIEPCKIALYCIDVQPQNSKIPYFVGQNANKKILTDDECRSIMRLPCNSFSESGRKCAAWLKSSNHDYNELDNLIDIKSIIEKQKQNLNEAQKEEIERITLKAKTEKSKLSHGLDDAVSAVKQVEKELLTTTDQRIKTLTLSRHLTTLQNDLKKREEQQFFEEMQIDVECEKQIDDFLGKNKPTAKAVRQCIITIRSEKQWNG